MSSVPVSIEGVSNSRGNCIFHKPDGHWYKRITMEAKYGESVVLHTH